MDSIPANKQQKLSALTRTLGQQKTPYAEPSQQSKGLTSITNGGTFVIYDSTGGTQIFSYSNPSNTIVLNSNLTINGTLSYNAAAGVRELQVNLVQSGASAGGVTSFFTNNGPGTPAYIDSSRFSINPSLYAGGTFVLEAVYRAGTNGQTARTFNMQLYDITGGSAVPASLIQGTNQSQTPPHSLPILRGVSNFFNSLAAGTRDYEVSYWSSDGTNFVDLYQARLIIQY